MILKKLRQPGPDVVALIFIIAILSWLSAFIWPQPPSVAAYDENPLPLFRLLTAVAGFSPLSGVIAAFLMMLVVSVLMVNFNTDVFFIGERQFFPAIIYILIIGLMPDQHFLNPVLPSAIFLIPAIQRVMMAYKLQWTPFPFFDAGLLIGAGSLFYAGLIWFGLLLFVGIIILRTWGIREFIVSLAGLATPVFIFTGFYYVAGNDMDQLMVSVKHNLFLRSSTPGPDIFSKAGLAVAAFITLICLVHLLYALNSKKVKSRKTFVLLIWIFLISAGMIMLLKSVSFEIIWLAAIPMSYFVSHYFVFARNRKIPEIMLITLLLMVMVIQSLKFFP